jgi:hypothetical protein
MTATATRRPAIAQGLRDLADFLDRHPALIDDRIAPGQHEDVTFIVQDAESVRWIADAAGTPVNVSPDGEGNVHTTTVIHFGRGSADHSTDAYENAVTLRVVRIEKAVAAS